MGEYLSPASAYDYHEGVDQRTRRDRSPANEHRKEVGVVIRSKKWLNRLQSTCMPPPIQPKKKEPPKKVWVIAVGAVKFSGVSGERRIQLNQVGGVWVARIGTGFYKKE